MKIRLKSFTLVEVVIAMLISSLVIISMTSFYLKMTKETSKNKRDVNRHLDYSFFYINLKRDIYKACEIRRQGNGLLIKDIKGNIIKYIMFKDKVIREDFKGRNLYKLSIKDYRIIRKRNKKKLELRIVKPYVRYIEMINRNSNDRY
jgi:competence protein ComGF